MECGINSVIEIEISFYLYLYKYLYILVITTSGAVGVSLLTTVTGSSGGAVIFLLSNI